MDIPAYTYEKCTNSVLGIVLYAEELDGKPDTPRERTRPCIVDDYAEDKIGQWAQDEVTGEQGSVDDERSCF